MFGNWWASGWSLKVKSRFGHFGINIPSGVVVPLSCFFLLSLSLSLCSVWWSLKLFFLTSIYTCSQISSIKVTVVRWEPYHFVSIITANHIDFIHLSVCVFSHNYKPFWSCVGCIMANVVIHLPLYYVSFSWTCVWGLIQYFWVVGDVVHHNKGMFGSRVVVVA